MVFLQLHTIRNIKLDYQSIIHLFMCIKYLHIKCNSVNQKKLYILQSIHSIVFPLRSNSHNFQQNLLHKLYLVNNRHLKNYYYLLFLIITCITRIFTCNLICVQVFIISTQNARTTISTQFAVCNCCFYTIIIHIPTLSYIQLFI